MENTYDEYGRAKGSKYVVDGKTKDQDVRYKTDSNLVSSVDWSHLTSTPQFTYKYDAFDRLISKSVDSWFIPDIYTDYTYKTRTSGDTTYTSSLVAKETLRTWKKTTTYAYTYDALGNITVIDKDGMLCALYFYDELNRLVEEYDAEARVSYSYTYDNAGNILSKSKNGVKTTYKYSTSAWGDLLTNYNGTTISYDKIGNPLNWRNAAALAWDGRQLQHLTSFYEDVVGYTYNADGIRVFKKYFDRQNIIIYNHSYVVDGANIVSETVTNSRTGATHTLYYFYDEKGEVAGFEYNGNAYYYQKNIQGDVLCICDVTGSIIAEYTYDSWGKVLSVTDAKGNAITDETHVANLNPFRYRSYYYDTETEFYYLNSRYYDPEVGRFLNADGIIGANGGITGYSMFAYCNNNPVIHYDPSGEFGINCLLDRSPEISNPGRKRNGIGGAIAGVCVIAGGTESQLLKDPVANATDRANKRIEAKLEAMRKQLMKQ